MEWCAYADHCNLVFGQLKIPFHFPLQNIIAELHIYIYIVWIAGVQDVYVRIKPLIIDCNPLLTNL